MPTLTNFLENESKEKISLRKSKRPKGKKHLKKWIYVLIGFMVVMGLIIVLSYPVAKAVYQNALSGKEDFFKAQGAIGSQDFKGAEKALMTANQKFTSAKKDFQKLKAFRFIPGLSRQISAIENILTAGINLSSGFQELAEIGDTVFSPLYEKGPVSLADISPEETKLILQKIYESPPLLQGAKAEIDLASQAIEEIPDSGLLGPIKKAVKPLKEQLPQIQNSLEMAIPASEAIPLIVGYPTEKTYLFLLQNNTELRPTGGFIGTYGILKLENGEITLFQTDNIYNLDNKVKDVLIEEPPAPLKKYLNADKWFMRDANWSPDFPTAAKKTEWFYHQEGGQEYNLNGVIAVTPTFIQSLLALTGEIKVNDITFTSENLIDTLQYQVERGFYREGISDAERKEVIGDLASKLLDKILALPSNRWVDLWNTFQNDIAEKQILIYLEDESLEKLILEEGWGGEIKQTEGDYFLVVDANMASLKSDPGVVRTINYNLTENEKGEFIANINIHYDNQGNFNWKSTRYRTYTRVYVPKGSELIESKGAMENDKLHGGRPGKTDVTEEFDKTCFGTFISIEPQTQGDLSFTYKLPSSLTNQIKNKKYNLYVQKQSGSANYGLNLDFSFKEKIDSFTPIDKGQEDGQNKVIFRSGLEQDREFTISLK